MRSSSCPETSTICQRSPGPRPRNPVSISARALGQPGRHRRHEDFTLRESAAYGFDGREDEIMSLAPTLERLVDGDGGDAGQATAALAQPQFPRLIDRQDANLQRPITMRDFELTTHVSPSPERKTLGS